MIKKYIDWATVIHLFFLDVANYDLSNWFGKVPDFILYLSLTV